MFSTKTLKIGTSLISKNELINKGLRLASSAKTSTQEPTKVEKTINNVTLLGRVGADPQKRGTESHPISVFSLATHTNYRYESGEFLQRTEWHRVVCFKPGLRETVLNYLRKGHRVLVTGRITYGEIRGEDGQPKSTTAIAAEDVVFLNSRDAQENRMEHVH